MDYIEQSTIVPDLQERDLACVELFSGIGAIACAFRRFGSQADEYDCLRHDPDENILTTVGFLKALQKVLRLEKRGLLYVGLPCASYIFMSSSQHRRSPEQPGGNENLGWVAQANTICCRSMLLVAVAIARQCFWALEQPSSSMVIYDPYVKFILSINDSDLNIFHQQTFWWMGVFGGLSTKRSLAIGSVPWLHKLGLRAGYMNKSVRQSITKQAVRLQRQLVKRGPGGKVTGVAKNLRASAAYPRGYADCIASCHRAMTLDVCPSSGDFKKDHIVHTELPQGFRNWNAANLQPILDFLNGEVSRGAFTPNPLIPLQLEPMSLS